MSGRCRPGPRSHRAAARQLAHRAHPRHQGRVLPRTPPDWAANRTHTRTDQGEPT
ncbi:hypothetical protein PV779_43015 [Streptomyces sp. ID01-9D]|nr:hypothetical protein [Streptomyces sp. ID01-9D]